MIVIAIGAVACALAAAFLAPPLLRRLTAAGHSPRPGAYAWLITSLTVVLCSAIAGALLIASPHDNHVVYELLRRACLAAFGTELPLTGARVAVGIALIIPLLRTVGVALTMWRGALRLRAMQQTLRLLGQSSGDGLIVVTAEKPMVYCIPGRPRTIVATTAARECLSPDQFQAVLSHERAHLAERHHLLVMLSGALRRAMPGLPLLRDANRFVTTLVEMRADDVACRRFEPALVAEAMSLLGSAGGRAPSHPSSALGAAQTAVLARVHRILDPPTRRRQTISALGSTAYAASWCFLQIAVIAVPLLSTALGDICLYRIN